MTLLDTLVAEPPPLQMNQDGVVTIAGTRVTLDTVIGAFKEGASADEIALAYDSLQLADVHAVIGHYLRHRTEAESYLNLRRQQSDQVRQQNEARFSPRDIRNRLLARRSSGHS
jgi:uncharacterized protein (DUF433 family)